VLALLDRVYGYWFTYDAGVAGVFNIDVPACNVVLIIDLRTLKPLGEKIAEENFRDFELYTSRVILLCFHLMSF